MQSVTAKTLATLEADTLLFSVGTKLSGDFYFALTWEEAVEAVQSRKSSGIAIEAANVFRERVVAISKDRFRQWNKLVVEIRPKVMSLVKKATKHCIQDNGLPGVVADHVAWDILHWSMELEYSDIASPGFYSQLGEVYLCGHIPCGWKGSIEKGKAIVY